MRRLITLTIAAACSAGLSAAINSPGAEGFFSRGLAMYDDHNYVGCIDQLVQLRSFTLTPRQSEDAMYYLAMATLHSDDDEALELLDEFMNRYPSSPRYQDALASTGDFYFTRGDYKAALQRYGRVNPEALTPGRHADLRYRTGYSQLMLGNYEQAAPCFEELRSDAEYGNAARFYLAYMAYEQKDYDRALELFGEVDATREPGLAAPYYQSQIYFMRGDYAKALDMALKVIDANVVPQFAPEANRIAGESYYNMGHLDSALPYLWRYAAQAENPQPSTLYILGVSEYESGNYETSIPLFQKATRAEGRAGQGAWLYLGQAYVKKGNADGALMAFEKAYTADVDPAVTETAFYNYIVALNRGGRMPFARTVPMLEDFLRRFPRSRYAATVQESLINGYMSDGDYDSALKALDKIKAPSDALKAARQRVEFELGRREYQAGNNVRARQLLTAALSGPSAELTHQSSLWLADCDYADGDWDKAAERYLGYAEQAPDTDPNRVLAYYNLGYTRYKQSRYAYAIADFNHVIERTADNRMLADAHSRIGDCLYQLHRFSEAASHYQASVDNNPQAGDYSLYQLAVMQGLQGQTQAQLSTLNRVINEFPSSSLVPAALLDRAEAYATQGETDRALSTYRDLIQQYPNSSYGRQGYLQMAITQMNAGRRNEALATYRRVVTDYPSSEEARVAVDDLKREYAADGRLAELTAFLESVPNSPRLTASEMEALAFQHAENAYLNTGSDKALTAYLDDYPHGASEAQAHYYLADAALNAGRYSDAIGHASEVTLNFPDSEVAEDAMLIKANAEAAEGKGLIALDTYRTLEKRAAGSRILTDARLGIMRTAADLGRWSEVLVATDNLKSSTAATADQAEISFCEGLALNGLGRKDEAYKVWDTLRADAASLYGAKAAVYESQSLLDAGKTARASQVINAFINANSPQQYWQARAFIVLSDILRRQGNEFEAEEYLRALSANYPGNEADIRQMIDSRLNK